MPSSFSRRDVLQRFALPAVATVALAGCTDRAAYVVERTAGRKRGRRRFVPVAADPGSVIRASAGLRPWRPPGYRLEAENLQGKQLIHNYGHGGGGMTLSWGTANEAVGMLTGMPPGSAAAVVGGGVVGLATALLLQRQGFAVTIHSAAFTPHTTSNASAATFFPSHVIAPDKVTPAFEASLETTLRTSYHAFQRLAGDRYGVRWTEAYYLSDKVPAEPPPRPDLEARLYAKIAGDMSVEVPAGEHPFKARKVVRSREMVIEPPIYLRALMDEFRLAGGRTSVRRFDSPRDLLQLSERAIFNCTGLGARELVRDPHLTPARGRLCILPPQPDVDYNLYHGDFYYMVPRKDGIVLGGTFEVGEESRALDRVAEGKLLAAHAAVFDAMR